jgi:sphinganine-1-phosphate aldolase
VKLKLEAAKGTQAKHTAWGGIYHEDGGELSAVQADAWALFNCSNTLYPATFPGVRKFEAEVVSMVLGLVQDSTCANKAVGLLTSGGTESIMVSSKKGIEKKRGRRSEGEKCLP